MNQENGHQKLIIFIILLILLIVGLGFFISWIKPSQTTPDDTEPVTGFSPFEQRTTYKSVDVPVTYAPSIPKTTSVPEPVTPKPAEPVETRIYTAPQDNFVAQTDNTLYAPVITKSVAPVVYEDAPQPIVIQNTYYVAPVERPVSTRSTTTNTTEDKSDGTSFAELDKQIFGYVSGLGWTQLLGDTGQKVFDFLYGTTPQGSTNATLGGLVGIGGSGGGFGGGFGGMGGGGSSLSFGGRVSRVTYCTCSASLMLDINDVRGQMISLIYQPGVSILYANYNVYGTGQNVLGNYSSGGSCLVYHGEDCSSEGSPQGMISQIGTSVQ